MGIRTWIWLGLAFTIAACGPTCGSNTTSAPPQPIVGYWTWHDGVIQVSSVGSNTYQGVMVKRETAPCPPPVGHVVLKITGNGTHYTGHDEWYRIADCATKFSSDAVVDLINNNNTAHLCSTGPFTDVAPVHDCLDLKRLPNYKSS